MRIDFDFSPVVRAALEEDLGETGDVSSQAVFAEDERSCFVLLSKDSGVLCGVEALTAVFAALDARVAVEVFFEDGTALSPGMIVARARGPVRALLAGERTALNLVSHLSGIATKTRLFVIAAGKKLTILDTRKTIPGLRLLEKYAVVCGGGANHRMGLFDMVMLKDNHIDASGGITKAVAKVRERWADRFVIEVETRNLDEVREALAAGADRIMFDNMNDDTMRKAVSIVAGKAETEASGNLSLERVAALAKLGVDCASFGELTHTVSAFDFSFKREKEA